MYVIIRSGIFIISYKTILNITNIDFSWKISHHDKRTWREQEAFEVTLFSYWLCCQPRKYSRRNTVKAIVHLFSTKKVQQALSSCNLDFETLFLKSLSLVLNHVNEEWSFYWMRVHEFLMSSLFGRERERKKKQQLELQDREVACKKNCSSVN